MSSQLCIPSHIDTREEFLESIEKLYVYYSERPEIRVKMNGWGFWEKGEHDRLVEPERTNRRLGGVMWEENDSGILVSFRSRVPIPDVFELSHNLKCRLRQAGCIVSFSGKECEYDPLPTHVLRIRSPRFEHVINAYGIDGTDAEAILVFLSHDCVSVTRIADWVDED